MASHAAHRIASSPPAPFTQRSPGSEARRVGRYELLTLLGRGGMADVHLAVARGPGGFRRYFAVKRPHACEGQTRRASARALLREGRIAGSIQDAHVVPVVDVGGTDEDPYLVMPYVEGIPFGSLLSLARRGRVQVPQAVIARIVLDALAGLAAAHELGGDAGPGACVLHRDVKPQNIHVGLDGVARVLDFGVARLATEAARAQKILMGTVAYMSPEQARGEPVDASSDTFSMGVVLWEALSGARLFKTASSDEGLRLPESAAPALRDVCPEVGIPIDDVCRRALARDPKDRYPRARAMARALELAAARTSGIASAADVAYYAALVGMDATVELRAAMARADSAPLLAAEPEAADDGTATIADSEVRERR
jgi:serine/threonine protein kinase